MICCGFKGGIGRRRARWAAIWSPRSCKQILDAAASSVLPERRLARKIPRDAPRYQGGSIIIIIIIIIIATDAPMLPH